MSESLKQGFFDDFYADSSDPWGFEDRWYEERKRAITTAVLPRRRFASAFEVGCSIGVLTADLAARCDRLLAVDIAAAPAAAATERLSDNGHVSVTQMATPEEWPSGRFDLIVLSEIGYYWSSQDLELALDRTAQSLAPDGILVSCHWRRPVAEYPLTGDDVHRAIGARGEFTRLVLHEEEPFLLEVFSRCAPLSPVAAESWSG